MTKQNVTQAILVVGALLAGLLGWLLSQYFFDPSFDAIPQQSPEPVAFAIDQPHPGFRHGSVDGSFIAMDDFNGDVVLVNFWATWCAPCREEMPMLQRLSEAWNEHGITIVGIAVDDVARVRTFVDELNVQYPILVGGPDVLATNRRWGNSSGALPYSVLVDEHGLVRWRHLGPLNEEMLVTELLRLGKALESVSEIGTEAVRY